MSQKPPMRSNKIAQPTRTIPTSELLRRFIPYYGPYKKIMFFDLACAALTIVCEMVLPMIIGRQNSARYARKSVSPSLRNNRDTVSRAHCISRKDPVWPAPIPKVTRLSRMSTRYR